MSCQNSTPITTTQTFALRPCYSIVHNATNARYDVRGSTLAELIKSCLANRGRVPDSLRAFCHSHVQQEALSYIEFFTERLLFGPNGRLSPYEYHYWMKPFVAKMKFRPPTGKNLGISDHQVSIQDKA